MKFLWHFRTGAWQVLKKAVLRRSVSTGLTYPVDYVERLAGGRTATIDDVVASRADWEEVQKRELVLARKSARTPDPVAGAFGNDQRR